MIHYEGYIHMYTGEHTTPTKLVFLYQNRDCNGEPTLKMKKKKQLLICVAPSHINLSMGIFLSQATDYCHTPQADRALAIQLKNEIKTCTIIIGESTSPITHSTLHKYPLSSAGEFQRNKAVMLMARRQHIEETVKVGGYLSEKLRSTYCDEGCPVRR